MNFCVLGLLIESLTGEPYEQAVYEQLLTPLGISGMRLASTYDPGPDEIEHRTSIGRNYMEVARRRGRVGGDAVRPRDDPQLARPRRRPGGSRSSADTVAAMRTSASIRSFPTAGTAWG